MLSNGLGSRENDEDKSWLSNLEYSIFNDVHIRAWWVCGGFFSLNFLKAGVWSVSQSYKTQSVESELTCKSERSMQALSKGLINILAV